MNKSNLQPQVDRSRRSRSNVNRNQYLGSPVHSTTRSVSANAKRKNRTGCLVNFMCTSTANVRQFPTMPGINNSGDPICHKYVDIFSSVTSSTEIFGLTQLVHRPRGNVDCCDVTVKDAYVSLDSIVSAVTMYYSHFRCARLSPNSMLSVVWRNIDLTLILIGYSQFDTNQDPRCQIYVTLCYLY
jgi:hypothetical protein